MALGILGDVYLRRGLDRAWFACDGGDISTRHPCEEKSEDVENGFDKLSSIEHTL